jgi:phage baseplate assembly protein gpV
MILITVNTTTITVVLKDSAGSISITSYSTDSYQVSIDATSVYIYKTLEANGKVSTTGGAVWTSGLANTAVWQNL